MRPGDRDEIADGYEQLSPESRRLRFFNAPDHLSERLLDYLTDVDGVDRVALVARAIDEPGTPGVGCGPVRPRSVAIRPPPRQP